MPHVYATSTDLRDWLMLDETEPLPQDAERLLARASLLLDAELIGARYATDEQGMPAGRRVKQALANAVCAQVAYWDSAGDDGTGASGQWSSASIGSASYNRPSGAAAGGGTGGSQHLAPHAVSVLRVAGLLPIHPTVRM